MPNSTPTKPKVNKITYRAVSDEYIRRWVPKLSPAQNAVMLALMTYLKRPKGQLGFVWPRLGTLGESAGIKRRQTVGEAIDALTEHGLIDKIDWPVNTHIGTRGDNFRILGGGDRRGKNLIFRLLHVDDAGVLHADPVRASAGQLRDFEDQRRRDIGEVTRLWFADEPASVIRDALASRWPSLEEHLPHVKPDEEQYCDLDWHNIMIYGISGAMDSLCKRWPLEGRNVPLSEVVWQRPGAPSFADKGHLAMGGIDTEKISRDLMAQWPAVFGELKALDSYGTRRLGLDNLALWKPKAPRLANVCEAHRIGPRRAIEWGGPVEDEHASSPDLHIVQEVA